MEINPEVVEGTCELAEEVLRRRMAAGREAVTESSQFSGGTSDPRVLDSKNDTQSSGGRMDGFNEKDAATLEAAKEALRANAAEGNVEAVKAFVSVLRAESERAALVAKSADKALGAEPATWQEAVSSGRQAGGEPAIAA